MVVFQNKIIYMPSVPPFSRSEKVKDYTKQCFPVSWKEHTIRSTDGTKIKLLEGASQQEETKKVTRHVVVLYFQGNASSLPPRLPYLSQILTAASKSSPLDNTMYRVIALSYRGFWTSSGTPNQPGIERDASAAIHWVIDNFSEHNTEIVLWGQSIGAGVATVGLANLLGQAEGLKALQRISGLLLETPFLNLRAMLVALYPQKFLPYRYLAPFLRSTWDSKASLELVAKVKPELKVLMLQAGDDELVPADNASILESICQARGIDAQRRVVAGALHTEVMAKAQGRKLISSFIGSFGHEIRR